MKGVANSNRRLGSGFTLIEAVLVVAISLGMTVFAVPMVTNGVNSYRQSAAVSAATGAISAIRFQAIMSGCPYQLVLTPSAMSYRVSSEVPAIGTVGCLTSFTNSSASVPLPSAGSITVTLVTCSVALTNWACTPLTDQTTVSGSTITYTFSPNGTVTTSPAGTSPAGVGLQIKNSVKSNTLWMSGVGNVGTSSP
jgi:Tfp pilus assembly protein FimT